MKEYDCLEEWLERVHQDKQRVTPEKDREAWDRIHKIAMRLYRDSKK